MTDIPTMRDHCRRLLVVHHEVHSLMFAAMMPSLRPAEIKRLKRQEGLARQERKQLCRLIRDEVRARMDAYANHRPWTQMELARRGTRHR